MLEDAAKDKILVIKHGALGDIIQALDAFALISLGAFANHVVNSSKWLR